MVVINQRVKKLAPYVLNFEGGFQNKANDPGNKIPPGWGTNKGVTSGAFTDLQARIGYPGTREYFEKHFTNDDATAVLQCYYDDAKLDLISSDEVASTILDGCWGSGVDGFIKMLQHNVCNKALGASLDVDGKMGTKTAAVINAANPLKVCEAMYNMKLDLYNYIVTQHPERKEWLPGWIRRAKFILAKFHPAVTVISFGVAFFFLVVLPYLILKTNGFKEKFSTAFRRF